MMAWFYRSLIGSVLSFWMVAWFGDLNTADKNQLDRLFKVTLVNSSPAIRTCDAQVTVNFYYCRMAHPVYFQNKESETNSSLFVQQELILF